MLYYCQYKTESAFFLGHDVLAYRRFSPFRCYCIWYGTMAFTVTYRMNRPMKKYLSPFGGKRRKGKNMGFGKNVLQKLFREVASVKNDDTTETDTVAGDGSATAGSLADTLVNNAVTGSFAGVPVNNHFTEAADTVDGNFAGSMAVNNPSVRRSRKTKTAASESLYPKILYILRCLLTGVMAAVFGSAGGIFSCYPFGIAFLAAVEGMAIPAFVGVLVGAVFSREYAFAASLVYLLALFMRILFHLMAERQAEQKTAA